MTKKIILDMSNASIKCKSLTKKEKEIEETHHVTSNTQTKIIVI